MGRYGYGLGADVFDKPFGVDGAVEVDVADEDDVGGQSARPQAHRDGGQGQHGVRDGRDDAAVDYVAVVGVAVMDRIHVDPAMAARDIIQADVHEAEEPVPPEDFADAGRNIDVQSGVRVFPDSGRVVHRDTSFLSRCDTFIVSDEGGFFNGHHTGRIKKSWLSRHMLHTRI